MKPELSDFGLNGIDSRPQMDEENHPVSDEERAVALEHLIRYQVETLRVVAFRNALREWEWEEHERERKG
jgi:hypothetical protein